MLSLETPIEKLAFVGPRNGPRLKQLGIKTIKDLLWHFPFRYEDFSQLSKISEAVPGNTLNISGQITSIKNTIAWRRRMTITEAFAEDDTGVLRIVWFNQPYLEKTLSAGTQVNLAGKISRDKRGIYLTNPTYEKTFTQNANYGSGNTGLIHTGRLVPIYPETEGISSKYLRMLISRILKNLPKFDDPLPKEIKVKYKLPSLTEAINTIHFPKNLNAAALANQRFSFENILLFQLRALRDRRQLQSFLAPKIGFNSELISSFVKTLPFELTGDQKIAAYEILKDLEKTYPMNRLLNGDVGSGKTIVALIAAVQTVNTGFQTAFMAPTEILAKQHYQTIISLQNAQELNIGLLTGSTAKLWSERDGEAKISKKTLREKIAKGKINLVIGTHAVIQKDVKFPKLGLLIIDEQHRFGIAQRMKLIKESSSNNLIPHLLSMTATPIPRTLALTIYGDLDISLLKEKPKGRQAIITKVVSHKSRQAAYKFIKEEIKKGRQVFVICPRIEMSNPTANYPTATDKVQLSLKKMLWNEVKAVEAEYEKLSREVFPDLRVAKLHGKMKPKEKDEIMNKFKGGHFDLLVSTSVIEVGVDVPNATLMMIESAERFGLAQLHQFRGRVGRGQHQSYCFLLTTDNESARNRRLVALEKTNDGFALAEIDLKIRGPGEFTGIKQSGMPDLAMASLTDLELIKKARLEAKLLLKEDPSLKKYPLLLAHLNEMQRLVHFE